MIHRREKLQVNVVQVQTLRSFYEDFKRKGFGVKRYEFSFCPISSFFNHPPPPHTHPLCLGSVVTVTLSNSLQFSEPVSSCIK